MNIISRKRPRFIITLAAAFLSYACAANAQSPSPTPSGLANPQDASARPNPEALRQARAQACLQLEDLYLKESTANIIGDPRVMNMQAAITFKRHSTLERLIMLAWATGCDLREFIGIEARRVNDDFNGATGPKPTQPQSPPPH